MLERNQGHPNIEAFFEEFKERYGIKFVVGVIGGSKAHDLKVYEDFLYEGFSALGRSRLHHTAIQSGGTEGGIPEMAVDAAAKIGVPSIGIYPEKGEKYALKKKLTIGIPIPAVPLTDITWGSESPAFVSIPNAFILIGGEWGTITEVAMITKKNIALHKKGDRMNPIITLRGTRGIADRLGDIARSMDTPKGAIIEIYDSRMLGDILTKLYPLK
jgi:predicted Rossmann-fold nucleotide-binding protein